jgi:hypothetical protein
MSDQKIQQLAINTSRTSYIDAVQAAKSGHPGTPMALAPLVYTIWNRAMNFDPQDPIWPTLCRHRRSCHRHENIRSLGTLKGAPEKFVSSRNGWSLLPKNC